MHNVHFLCENHLYYLSKQRNGEPCHFVIFFLTENFQFDRQPLMNCMPRSVITIVCEVGPSGIALDCYTRDPTRSERF